MSKKKMSIGKDGITDKYGEELPELSKHASVLEYEKLLDVKPPDFSRKTPGSPFWTRLAYFVTQQSINLQFKTFEISGKEKMSTDRGNLTVCWHTNGIMDVMPIINHHPNHLVVGGRHDLVNHPILGFWARRLAVQPVVRQAELIRGGCTKEEAKYLNGRSLLRLSKGISSGFGGILMPEGTSHQNSHLIRLKTGPARVLTSAATIASFEGKLKPNLVPVGMHFRKRHLFRTDIWIECCDPVEYKLSQELLDMGSKYVKEEWIEPPAQDVYQVRDLLRENLDQITPGAINWDVYRGWRLLGHLKSRFENKASLSWREEVVYAREWRKLSDECIGTHLEQKESGPKESEHMELFLKAEEAAKILDKKNLDGSVVDIKGELSKVSWKNIFESIPGVLLGIILFPFLLFSSGLIMALCYYLGNVTDEGEDARTSVHYVGFITTPLIIWPFISILAVYILAVFFGVRPAITGLEQITLFHSIPFYMIIWAIMFPLFWLINVLSFTFCFDSINTIYTEYKIYTLGASNNGKKLEKLLKYLNSTIKELYNQSGHN
ncbi:MAG: hypothetical protein CMB56_002930 [Methanobacteriota archaeon]|nr:MAG: hypothetical protein CMB56_002930 [Euryarchaeota archaeon]|tara:strand:- start:646 stop:2292 length:1647 start_codon:yes stop_codon:yes gene_type:complete